MPLRVALSNVGNIDFGQDPNRPLPGVPCRTVRVRDLAHASEVCRDYIEKHDLGGGNWSGGVVTDGTGAEVGRVSYNGRVWPPGPSRMGDAPLYDPAPPKPRQADPLEWETAEIDVPGHGRVRVGGCLRTGSCESVTGRFAVGGERGEFMTDLAFDENGFRSFRDCRFLPGGVYEAGRPLDRRARTAVEAAVREWAEDPANMAMIMRNTAKDHLREARWARDNIASVEAKLAELRGRLGDAERLAREAGERAEEMAARGAAPRH